jgi:hypothetical protein
MNDVMLKGFAKTLKPMVAPAAQRGEKELTAYLSSIELHENETGAVVVLDTDPNGQLMIVVATVNGRVFERKIAEFTKEQIVDFILKQI